MDPYLRKLRMRIRIQEEEKTDILVNSLQYLPEGNVKVKSKSKDFVLFINRKRFAVVFLISRYLP